VFADPQDSPRNVIPRRIILLEQIEFGSIRWSVNSRKNFKQTKLSSFFFQDFGDILALLLLWGQWLWYSCDTAAVAQWMWHSCDTAAVAQNPDVVIHW